MVIPISKSRSDRPALEHHTTVPWPENSNLDLELSRLVFIIKRTEETPSDRITYVLSQLAGIQANVAAAQATLIGRIIGSQTDGKLENDDIPERWLTSDEAAALLKVDRKWLYRRANALPFARRLSRKKLLFSESGLRRWIANRRP